MQLQFSPGFFSPPPPPLFEWCPCVLSPPASPRFMSLQWPKVHDDWVTDMLTIPELGLLTTCSLDRTIKMWDLSTMAVKGVKEGHEKGALQSSGTATGAVLTGVQRSASATSSSCLWHRGRGT